MRCDSQKLLHELKAILIKILTEAKAMQDEPLALLKQKPAINAWNALECIEHLNRYAAFYLPAIKNALTNGKNATPSSEFKSGWLGNWFANMMKVGGKGYKRMKSPADKNPMDTKLTKDVLQTFLVQTEELTSLLDDASGINLTTVKTPVSISSFIKLRLGDTLRFVIYHMERHMIQAQQALNAAAEKSVKKMD